MKDWGFVILAVAAAGVLLVVVPVFVAAFSRFRAQRSVACPETGRVVGIKLDALRLSVGAAFDRVPLHVRACTLWPERRGCAQSCLNSIREAELRPARPAA